MIHTLFDKHRLEGAPNFRDLGGLPAADGRRIKPGRLLRCGHLEYLTAADCEKLLQDYGLKTVVDLRTDRELLRHPDTILPGVTYLRRPVFQQSAEGVTREAVRAMSHVESAMSMARNMDGHAHERMAELYRIFLMEEGIAAYTAFFNDLLAQEDGALLWHCTMGKDRCGTGAVLVETALGVPDPLILADYLYTNRRLRPQTEETIAAALAQGEDPALMDQLRIMDSVHEDYLAVIYKAAEECSGSLMQFIREKLEMTDEKLEKLRNMYLE